MFSLKCSSETRNRKQVFGLPDKSQEQRNVSKILEREEIIRLHIRRYLRDDLASQFSPWLVRLTDNRSPYQVAFVMESIYHFKSLQPAHFFTFPNHWAVTPRPCLWKQAINALTLCTSGSSLAARLPGFCIKSACGSSSAHCGFLGFLCLSHGLSERLLGLPLHEHLAGVCAICAFSQQVITNRSLTSHSVQLDSLCWHSQGQLSEVAGWQQLDSKHYGVKGKAAESQQLELNWGESMWRKTAYFLSQLT